MTIIKAPVRALRANVIAERFVGTVHRELLDRLLIVYACHPRVVLATREQLAEHHECLVERCTALARTATGDAWLFSPTPDGSEPYRLRYLTQRYR